MKQLTEKALMSHGWIKVKTNSGRYDPAPRE